MSTAERIAIAEEEGVLRQLAQHHGGGSDGITAAFRQRAVICHPDTCGEGPDKFRRLVQARDNLLRQARAVEAALPRNPTKGTP